MFLTMTEIQTIADTCARGGFNFHLAITTAARDGKPWYRRETPDAEYERHLKEAHAA